MPYETRACRRDPLRGRAAPSAPADSDRLLPLPVRLGWAPPRAAAAGSRGRPPRCRLRRRRTHRTAPAARTAQHATAEHETPVMTWREKAACRGEDPELFFPIGTTGRALDQIELAKSVCRDCDVTAHCLEESLKNNEDAGVWGGMSEDERRTLRRSRQRPSRRAPRSRVGAGGRRRSGSRRGRRSGPWARSSR